MLIGDTLAANAQARPHAPGLIFGERTLSWRDLNAGANRVANALVKLGVRPGDRVVYPLENSVEFVELFFGLAKIGVIGAPVLAYAVANEIAHTIVDLDAKFAICGAGARVALKDIQSTCPSLAGIVGIGEHDFGLDYTRLCADALDSEPEFI